MNSAKAKIASEIIFDIYSEIAPIAAAIWIVRNNILNQQSKNGRFSWWLVAHKKCTKTDWFAEEWKKINYNYEKYKV